MDYLLIIILIIMWCITLYMSYYLLKNWNKIKYKSDPIQFDFKNNMNRTQKKLFDKQIINFKKTFSNFSNYQLNAIKQLIEDILKERK